jgi:predicted metalloprotease with PDZ domain
MPLITATVVKEETGSKLGIAFERTAEDKAMTIKLIRDDSLFKGSDLVEGLIVASAAGKDMEGMSPKDCADALRDAPGGEEISLVCKGAVITVEKEKKKRFKKEAKLGISFKSTTSAPGKIFVSMIKEESKFAGTDLTVGHQILAINGQTCPPRVTDAVELLTKKGVDTITLVTIDPEDEIVVPKPKEELAEVTEEKKDDEEVAADAESKGEEEDLTPEGNKSLIDTMFGVCMC